MAGNFPRRPSRLKVYFICQTLKESHTHTHTHTHSYSKLISAENILGAWSEFQQGKRKKFDVQLFERHLEENLFKIHLDLKNKKYKHGCYEAFYVQDPKRRHIHKASVRDRIIHHLLYKYLYDIFDKTFIYDSYSCRLDKGTHRGVKRLESFTRKISRNYTKPCFALKCDISKFFASLDHEILKALLKRRIKDKDILWLLDKIINSFNTANVHPAGVQSAFGIPLGNLTSQIFANIYLHELDYFIKQKLKIKYYIRYADDFIILSKNRDDLTQLINQLSQFVKFNLKLQLHPKKIILRKLEWGIDFLGYTVLPHYILPRTKTKRRMFKKIKEKVDLPTREQSLQSYLGYLSHSNSFKLSQRLKNQVWFWSTYV